MNNKMNNLVFAIGLVIGTLSFSTPWESASNNTVKETTSSLTSVTLASMTKPESKKKTYSPRPPKTRYA